MGRHHGSLCDRHQQHVTGQIDLSVLGSWKMLYCHSGYADILECLGCDDGQGHDDLSKAEASQALLLMN